MQNTYKYKRTSYLLRNVYFVQHNLEFLILFLIIILNIYIGILYIPYAYKLAAPRIVFFFGQHFSRDY